MVGYFIFINENCVILNSFKQIFYFAFNQNIMIIIYFSSNILNLKNKNCFVDNALKKKYYK